MWATTALQTEAPLRSSLRNTMFSRSLKTTGLDKCPNLPKGIQYSEGQYSKSFGKFLHNSYYASGCVCGSEEPLLTTFYELITSVFFVLACTMSAKEKDIKFITYYISAVKYLMRNKNHCIYVTFSNEGLKQLSHI